GDVGLEPKRLTPFGDRRVELPLVTQGGAEGDVSPGVIWLEPKCLTEDGDRPIQVPLRSQRGAEVNVDSGVIRLESKNLTEYGDRLLTSAHPFQEVPHLVRRLGAKRPRRCVIPQCLLPLRRTQTVQILRQDEIDPHVARVPLDGQLQYTNCPFRVPGRVE